MWRSRISLKEHGNDVQRAYYVYKRLGNANSIRLLKLERVDPGFPHSDAQHETQNTSEDYHNSSTGEHKAGISYSLIETTIEEAPPYEALSCVWGTSLLDQVLLLGDGVSLKISQTLHEALPRISKHCITGYIWIDQICINQEDLTERNGQISMMGQIYSECSHVLVWLGFLPSLIPELEDACTESSRMDPMNLSEVDEFAILSRLQTISNVPEVRRAVVNGLCALLFVTWWTRAWVFQEVVLQQHSIFILNERTTVSPSGLRWVLRYYWRLIYEAVWAYPQGIFEGGEGIRSTYRLWKDRYIPNDRPALRLEDVLPDIFSIHATSYDIGIRSPLRMHDAWTEQHQGQYHPQVSFAEVLSNVTSRANTFNKLDQIYAYLGLNMDRRIDFSPDYEMQPRTALISMVQAIVRGTSRLDIFETIPRQNIYVLPVRFTFAPLQNLHERYSDWVVEEPAKQSSSVPTWCPDYWRRRSVEPFKSTAASNLNEGVSSVIYPWSGIWDDNTLRAHGRVIDTVQRRLTDNSPEHANDTSDKYLSQLLKAGIKAWHKDTSVQPTTSPVPSMNRLLQSMLVEGHTAVPYFKAEELAAVSSTIPGSFDSTSYSPNVLRELKRRIMNAIKTIMNGRNLYLTKGQRFATSNRLRRGDIICVLHGCFQPCMSEADDRDKVSGQRDVFLGGLDGPLGI